MITQPTNRQLIEAVCAELTNKVAPTITDGSVKVVLDMALAVLAGAAVRTSNELAWMREEADAIEAVAARLAGELPEAKELAAALDAYRAGKTSSLYIDDAKADYQRASELLSCVAEATFADGDAARMAAVDELFAQRMANENTVTGQFLAVGRT